jgi:hypothetical protein
MTRRAVSVAAIVTILAAESLAAASPSVTTAGVRGGDIEGLAWDPTHATTVWAAVHGAGLYKSTNGGGAWSEILLPTITPHVVNKVLPSKAAADLLLVCDVAPSLGGIWRSANGGTSFAGVLPTSTGSCTALVDGTAANTMYAGIQDANNTAKVYKSVDAGQSWTSLGLNQPGVLVTDIVKLASGRVVVGTRDGAGGVRGNKNSGSIFYSDDEGAHWTAGTGIGTGAIAGMATNGGTTIIALATGVNATLYTSSDGAAWSAGTSFTGTSPDAQIAYHAGSDTFFLMPANDQLLQSTAASSGGYTFGSATNKAASLSAPVAFSVGHHAAFAVDPADATHILVGDVAGGEGIFTSADGGGTWAVANDGLFAQQVDFAFKTTKSGYRYAANRTGFVYFGGTSLTAPWLRVFRATDLTRDPVVAMAADTADDKRLVVAQSNLVDQALLRLLPDATNAADEGSPFAHSAWTTLTYPDAAKSPVLALLVDGMTMLAGVALSNTTAVGQYLYLSTNGGTSWTPTSLSVVGGVRALAFDPSSHMTIYAGAGDFKGDIRLVGHVGGLWKSTDGGAHFSRISTGNATLDGEAPRTIVVDPANGQRVWVHADRPNSTTGSDGDLFESLDGGATWTTITPSNPVLAFTYSPAEDLLAYSTNGANVNIYVKHPGDGTSTWDPGVGVYGAAQVLYAGSIGAGTATGLFEATGVMAVDGDMGVEADAGSGPGGQVDHDLGVMPPMESKGCGCGLVPASGAALWSTALLLAVFVLGVRLLFRRRAKPAPPRA